MHYAVKAAVYCAAVVILGAEVGTGRLLLILGQMQRMLHQLLYTLALGGRYRHYRNAQDFLHLVHTDRAAVTGQLIHHIESQHHRHAQLHELNRQVEVALYVGCIDYIYNTVGLLFYDELA